MPRPLTELTATDDPAWPKVQAWIASAKNAVEVLPPSKDAAEELYLTQVTLRSPMGAIVYQTGGLLIDGGWVRVLGSGHPRLPRTLMRWNAGKSIDETGHQPGHLLIADDMIGGFFAINGGALGPDVKSVHYFAPDSLRWESLGGGYSDFIDFLLNGDLDRYYAPYRWPGWREEIAPLGGDQALSLYPFLWTAEGKDPLKSERRAAPVEEVYGLNVVEFPRQLAGTPPPGTRT